MSRLRVGDAVRIGMPGEEKRGRFGRILGFEPREEWRGTGMGGRSFRSHWVVVTFPDGSAITVPPTAVKRVPPPTSHAKREETELG